MKRFFICWVLGILILAGPPAVFAQEGYVSNRYIAGYMGFGSHPDATTTISGFGTFDFDVDPGFVAGVAIGVALENHLRFEGEFGYHGSSIDDAQFFVPGESLDIDVFSVMANGYYDLDLNGPLKPYVGAGLGFGFIHAESENFLGFTDTDTDVGFAYQLMAGVAFDVSPRAAITLGYRYFGTTDPDFSVGGANFDTEFKSHEFLAGVRFRF